MLPPASLRRGLLATGILPAESASDGHTRTGVLRGPSLLLGLVWDRARPLSSSLGTARSCAACCCVHPLAPITTVTKKRWASPVRCSSLFRRGMRAHLEVAVGTRRLDSCPLTDCPLTAEAAHPRARLLHPRTKHTRGTRGRGVACYPATQNPPWPSALRPNGASKSPALPCQQSGGSTP